MRHYYFDPKTTNLVCYDTETEDLLVLETLAEPPERRRGRPRKDTSGQAGEGRVENTTPKQGSTAGQPAAPLLAPGRPLGAVREV